MVCANRQSRGLTFSSIGCQGVYLKPMCELSLPSIVSAALISLSSLRQPG